MGKEAARPQRKPPVRDVFITDSLLKDKCNKKTCNLSGTAEHKDFFELFFLYTFIYRLTGDEAGTPYDKESMAIIHLNNTTVMYLKEVTKFLALVCFLREESFERKGELSGQGNMFGVILLFKCVAFFHLGETRASCHIEK